MSAMSHAQRPLLVSVVAGAISTIGFGMSVAAIWLVWLMPTTKPHPPIITKKQKVKSRRRSAPPLMKASVLESPVVSPVPAILIPDNSPPSENRLSRHVYFLDSQIRVSTSRRYTVTPELKCQDAGDDDEPVRPSPSSSPHSSTTTLASIPTPLPLPDTQFVTVQQQIDEPEKLTRPTTPRGFRTFSKMMNRKGRPSTAESMDSGELSQSESFIAPVRRANTITLPAWPRGRRNSDNESTCSSRRLPFRFPNIRAFPSRSANSSREREPAVVSPVTAAIFTKRTHQRRASGSARTQPYEYPYFAVPPTVSSGDLATAHSKQGGVITRGREPSERTSSRPQRPIHKRRSASTGWIDIKNEATC